MAGEYLSSALLICGTAYFVASIMDRLRVVNDRLVRSEKFMVLGQVTGYIAHEVNNSIV